MSGCCVIDRNEGKERTKNEGDRGRKWRWAREKDYSRGKDSRKSFSDRTCDKKLSTTRLIINAHPEGLIDPIRLSKSYPPPPNNFPPVFLTPYSCSFSIFNFIPLVLIVLLFTSCCIAYLSLFFSPPLSLSFFVSSFHIFHPYFFLSIKSVTRVEMFFHPFLFFSLFPTK